MITGSVNLVDYFLQRKNGSLFFELRLLLLFSFRCVALLYALYVYSAAHPGLPGGKAGTGLLLLANRLHQPSYISQRKQNPEVAVARKIIGITCHARHMVRTNGASETNVVISLHCCVHINLSFVVKGF